MIKTAIKYCAIASKELGPRTFHGYIYIKGLEGALHLQATDGARLHSVKCYVEHDLPVGTIVKAPTKSLVNLVKTVGKLRVDKVSLKAARHIGQPLTFHLPDTLLTVASYVTEFDPLQVCQDGWAHRNEPVELIGFDTGLLADAHKAFSMLKPIHGAVNFQFYGALAGAMLKPGFQPTVADLHDACVVIMPCPGV